MKIYKALETSGIRQCSKIEVSEHLKTCIQLSGALPPTIPEFQFLVNFVIDNFSQYRIKELGTAFEMYALDKLSVDKHFGNFSPKFLGDVMSAYKPIAVAVRLKVEPKTQRIEGKVNEEQAIQDEVSYWKTSKKDWQYLNPQVFDYLWKRKLLKLDEKQSNFIKDSVKTFLKYKYKDEVFDEIVIKNNCKKYAISMYLNNQL